MRISTLVPLAGANNTRDLGGMEAAGGKTIKPRRLFRSGALGGCTQEDLKALKAYGLRTIIDFRTATEREEQPDPDIAGVESVCLPIMDEDTMGITRERQGQDSVERMLRDLRLKGMSGQDYMAEIYGHMAVAPYSRRQYGRFLDLALSQEEGAVLWHCSAGKDRVGVGTAILQSALGTPWEAILEDYLATNDFTREFTAGALDALSKKSADPVLSQIVSALFSVEERYLQAVFDTIREEFGSMDAYLEKGLGLTPEKKARLRALYLC